MSWIQYREGDASTADIIGQAIMFETAGVMGNLKDTNPLPVSGSLTVSPPTSGTSALSNVASSASSVTLLASNSNRKGATIYNDSTQVLYVKFGTTASATSYTVYMIAGAYYEVPFNYTGRIDGIWASANGNARITELTA